MLTLGWKMTPNGDPAFWLSRDARPGSQTQEDLITVNASLSARHTLMIAQSGSGKSFFLGRLVEEILLGTRAECVILDPNADFRRVNEVVGSDLWTNAKYDLNNRRGFLPHEPAKSDFSDRWAELNLDIHRHPLPFANEDEGYKPFKIWWPALTVDLLTEEVSPLLRTSIRQCHLIVQLIQVPAMLCERYLDHRVDVLGLAEKYFRIPRDGNDGESYLGRELKLEELLEALSRSGNKQRASNITLLVGRIAAARRYVSDEAISFYFGQARELETEGLLADGPNQDSEPRLKVFDLPSLSDTRSRSFAVSNVLSSVWSRARAKWEDAVKGGPDQDIRTPTFVVIDEAHNLAPANPTSFDSQRSILDQLRTMAAEGRKYGVFLLLVTQRPDKIDPLIISECQNIALMKLSTESLLDTTQALLGLGDVSARTMRKCLDFGIGRAMLVGDWAPNGPLMLYSAARRTVEGGRNLRPEYWANPV